MDTQLDCGTLHHRVLLVVLPVYRGQHLLMYFGALNDYMYICIVIRELGTYLNVKNITVRDFRFSWW